MRSKYQIIAVVEEARDAQLRVFRRIGRTFAVYIHLDDAGWRAAVDGFVDPAQRMSRDLREIAVGDDVFLRPTTYDVNGYAPRPNPCCGYHREGGDPRAACVKPPWTVR